jgi:hypothetical protein
LLWRKTLEFGDVDFCGGRKIGGKFGESEENPKNR